MTEIEKNIPVTMLLQIVTRHSRKKDGKSRYDKIGDGKADVVQILKNEENYKPKKNGKSMMLHFVDGEDHNVKTLPVRQVIQATGHIRALTKQSDIFYIDKFISLSNAAMNQMISDYHVNPQDKRNELIARGESDTLAEAEEVPFDDSLQPLNELLTSYGWKFDLEMPALISSFFYRRVRKHPEYEDVYNFIQQNPLVLMELSYLDPQFSPSRVLEKVKGKPSDKVRIYAELCSLLHRKAQAGDSCVPYGTVLGCLSHIGKDLGINNISDKVHEIIKEVISYNKKKDNEEPVVATPDIVKISAYSKIKTRNIGKNLAPYSKQMYDYFFGTQASELKDQDKANERAQKLTHNSVIYLERLYWKEIMAAKYTAELCSRNIPMNDCLDIMEAENLNHFDTEQKDAIQKAFKYPVTAIVGGAGTGKTRVIAEIIRILSAAKKNAIILAPSAKAALHAAEETRKILGNDTAVTHQTIHRFARILPEDEDNGTKGDMITVNPDEEAEKPSYDMVIIDEISMCTLPVFEKVARILIQHPKTHLVLVGDNKQLPAIGPQFWGQICNCQLESCMPITILEHNHRAESSALAKFANYMRYGSLVFPEDDKHFHLYQDSMTAFIKAHEKLLKNPNTMVLAAKKVDIDRLNRELRVLRQNDKAPLEHTGFYLHDPIITTRNDYHDHKDEIVNIFTAAHHKDRDFDIFNGTEGIIESYDKDSDTVYVRLYSPDFDTAGKLVPYRLKELAIYFQPAYALTVHKAQGSQADTVVLYLSEKISVTNALLYTAVTRAKKDLWILSTEEALKAAVNKNGHIGLTYFAFLVMREIDKAKQKKEKSA